MQRLAALVGLGIAAWFAAPAAQAQGITATGAWDCRIDLAVTCPVEGADRGCLAQGEDINDRDFVLDLDRGVIAYPGSDGGIEVEFFGRTDLEDRAQSLYYTEYSQVLTLSQPTDGAITLYETITSYTPPITDEMRIGHCLPR